MGELYIHGTTFGAIETSFRSVVLLNTCLLDLVLPLSTRRFQVTRARNGFKNMAGNGTFRTFSMPTKKGDFLSCGRARPCKTKFSNYLHLLWFNERELTLQIVYWMAKLANKRGKGLGKDNQGRLDYVKVSKKENTSGVRHTSNSMPNFTWWSICWP